MLHPHLPFLPSSISQRLSVLIFTTTLINILQWIPIIPKKGTKTKSFCMVYKPLPGLVPVCLSRLTPLPILPHAFESVTITFFQFLLHAVFLLTTGPLCMLWTALNMFFFCQKYPHHLWLTFLMSSSKKSLLTSPIRLYLSLEVVKSCFSVL